MRTVSICVLTALSGCAYITSAELEARRVDGFQILDVDVRPEAAFACEGTAKLVGSATLPADFVGATVVPEILVDGNTIPQDAFVLVAKDGDAVYEVEGTVALPPCREEDGVCDVELELVLTLHDHATSITQGLRVLADPDPSVASVAVLDAANREATDYAPERIDALRYPYVEAVLVEPTWSALGESAGTVSFVMCPSGIAVGAPACVSSEAEDVSTDQTLRFRAPTLPVAQLTCADRWGGEIPLFDVYVAVDDLPCDLSRAPVKVLERVRFVHVDDCDGDGDPAPLDCRDFDASVAEAECDADGDGHVSVDLGGDDCDDTQGTIYPGADEACDGVDTDCDPSTELALSEDDVDGDGYVACAGYQPLDGASPAGVVGGADCHPLDDLTYPGAAYNDSTSACMTDADGDGWGSELYLDADNDGLGSTTVAGLGCVDADYVSFDSDDCDDEDDAIGVAQLWPADADGDGFTGTGTTLACAGTGLPPGDCDDTDPAIHPNTEWFEDADHDGYGHGPVVATGCGGPPPLDQAPRSGDCEDTMPGLYPGRSTVWSDANDPATALYYDGFPPPLPDVPTVVGVGLCGELEGTLHVDSGAVIISGFQTEADPGIVTRVSAPVGQRALEVADGADVVLFGVTLVGSDIGTGQMPPSQGGVALIEGIASFSLVEVTGGTADKGGGIAVADGGTLTVVGGVVRDNVAEVEGGAVYAEGAVRLCSTELVGNDALANGPGGNPVPDPGKDVLLSGVGAYLASGLVGALEVTAFFDPGARVTTRGVVPTKGPPDPAPQSFDPNDLVSFPSGTFACDESGCVDGAAATVEPCSDVGSSVFE